MKRSEMLDALIRDILAHQISNAKIDIEKLAEEVLNRVEDKGMLPPEYNLNEGSGKYNIPSDYVYEWEQEE